MEWIGRANTAPTGGELQVRNKEEKALKRIIGHFPFLIFHLVI